MAINRKLLPIKLHFFFFMAASGPILPFLTVYGKQLGISEIVMGIVTAVLPIVFFLAKPLFGFLADFFIHQRKLIFMFLISILSLFYVSLYFIPPVPHHEEHAQRFNVSELFQCSSADTFLSNEDNKIKMKCNITCSNGNIHSILETFYYIDDTNTVCAANENKQKFQSIDHLQHCILMCTSENHIPFHSSFEFFGFITFMSLSMITFNVANSINDAICFDILGKEQNSYGKQRVWGAVGFGITALIAGFGMDFYSEGNIKNYSLAFILVLVFTLLDLLCCTKLKLPKMMSSENILKDVVKLLKNKDIILFLVFATFAGFLDSFIIYFLFWFLEDLAIATDETKYIKVLEGLTVAAETLGSEILFFPLSGKIVDKIGYNYSLTICFFNYGLRLGLISLIPNPWWVLAIELFMQGPTYALTYTVIVGYANTIAPPGTSATMQGLVAGMDDGLGYAAGSLIGGFLYKSTGGRIAFQYYCLLSFICCFIHFISYNFCCTKSDTLSQNHHPTGQDSRSTYSFEAIQMKIKTDEKISRL